MNPFQNLNLAIRQLRKRAGLSQRAAVEKIRAVTGSSINTMMVSRWERGERSPSVDSLGAFLWGLGYSLRDLCDALEEVARTGFPRNWWQEALKQLEVDEGSRREAARKLRAALEPPLAPAKPKPAKTKQPKQTKQPKKPKEAKPKPAPPAKTARQRARNQRGKAQGSTRSS